VLHKYDPQYSFNSSSLQLVKILYREKTPQLPSSYFSYKHKGTAYLLYITHNAALLLAAYEEFLACEMIQ